MQKKRLSKFTPKYSVFYILLIFLVAIIFIADFTTQIKRAQQESVSDALNIFEDRQRSEIKEFFNFSENSLRIIAATISENAIPNDEMFQLLAVDSEIDGDATALFFSDINGMAYNENGEQDPSLSGVALECIANNICTISEPLHLGNNQTAVVLSVPILVEGKAAGALSRLYYTEKLSSTIFPNTDEGIRCFIFTAEGDILFKSQNISFLKGYDNALDFFKNSKYNKKNSAQDILQSIAQGTPLQIELKTSLETYQSKVYLLNDQGWYTYIGINDNLFETADALTTSIMFKTSLKVCAIVCMFILILFYKNHEKTRSIRENNRKFSQLLANMQGGIITYSIGKNNKGFEYKYISESFSTLLGYTKQELNDLVKKQPYGFIHPDDFTFYEIDYMQQISKRESYQLQYRVVAKDGSVIWIMDKGRVISKENDRSVNQSILTDITDIKKKEKALLQSEERLRAATEQAKCAIFDYDMAENRFLSFMNTENLFLLSEKEMFARLEKNGCQNIGDFVSLFFYGQDIPRIKKAHELLQSEGKAQVEARLVNPDNNFIWVNMSCSLLIGDNNARIIGFISDINTLKTVNESLRVEVQTDPMTGIYNKKTVMRLSQDTLSSKSGQMNALMVIDIDNFKGVNDTLGHLFGDAVLIDVSAKLKRLFRENDIVGRIGGDEFVVFMRNISNANIAARKAQQICDEFKKTYTGENADYKVSCSVGLCASDTITDYKEMFSNADKALYQAKNNGKDGFWLYTGEEAMITTKPTIIDRHTHASLSKKDRIFQMLCNAVDFETTIKLSLDFISSQYHVNRIYVFENTKDDCLRNTLEWCAPNQTPLIDERQAIKCYYEKFDSNGIFICPEQNNENLPSGYQVMVSNYGKPSAVIGFELNSTTEALNAERISDLSDISKIIGMFVLKHRAEQKN